MARNLKELTKALHRVGIARSYINISDIQRAGGTPPLREGRKCIIYSPSKTAMSSGSAQTLEGAIVIFLRLSCSSVWSMWASDAAFGSIWCLLWILLVYRSPCLLSLSFKYLSRLVFYFDSLRSSQFPFISFLYDFVCIVHATRSHHDYSLKDGALARVTHHTTFSGAHCITAKLPSLDCLWCSLMNTWSHR